MISAVTIEAEAAAWIAKRDRYDWTPAQQADLNAWLSRSAAHKVAFIRLDAVWTLLDGLRVA